jgi:hypothetical protein
MKKRAGLIAKRGFDQRTPLDLDKIDSILATLGVKSYPRLLMPSRRGLPPVVILAGGQSEPRRHVPSTPKDPGVANGGDQRRGVDCPDPGDRHQASHRLFIPRHLEKLFVKDRNTLVEDTPFGAQFAPALRRHDPTLQQQSAQMVESAVRSDTSRSRARCSA